MVSFEYRIQDFPNIPTETTLKGWGVEGWELCGVDQGHYIFKRRRPRRTRAVRVTDTHTSETSHYDTLQEASEAVGSSPTALNYALAHHTLYLKRYKVEEDND